VSPDGQLNHLHIQLAWKVAKVAKDRPFINPPDRPHNSPDTDFYAQVDCHHHTQCRAWHIPHSVVMKNAVADGGPIVDVHSAATAASSDVILKQTRLEGNGTWVPFFPVEGPAERSTVATKDHVVDQKTDEASLCAVVDCKCSTRVILEHGVRKFRD
jgi:hypothetical protein